MPFSIVDVLDSDYGQSIIQEYLPIILSDPKVFFDFEVLPSAISDIFTSFDFSTILVYFISLFATAICFAPDVFELILVNTYDPTTFNQSDPTLRGIHLYLPLFIKGLATVLEAGNFYLGFIVWALSVALSLQTSDDGVMMIAIGNVLANLVLFVTPSIITYAEFFPLF